MTTDLGELRTNVGAHYCRSRERIQALLRDAADEAGALQVVACPGWSVHDVIAHLVGVIEDAAAGRLQGLPTEALTAAQVARHRATPLDTLLDRWDVLGPVFEARLTELGIWPAMFDVLSHEHDIRSALEQPAAQDIDSIRIAAGLLRESLHTDTDIRVTFSDVGEEMAVPGDESSRCLRLTTTSFEFFRLRLGRRSVQQVAAMQWSRNPVPAFDGLFVFGPAASAIDETIPSTVGRSVVDGA